MFVLTNKYVFLQDLIDRDLPKAVDLLNTLTEQVC